MKSISVKKLYKIHSWVGLITGILLFVIAFTGAISVFGRPEIKIWANPDIREGINVSASQIESAIEEQAKQIPQAYLEEIIVFLPGARTYPNLTVLFENHDEGQAILLSFDNDTLAVIDKRQGSTREVFAERRIDIADFIVDFHADLHLGRPVGLLLTGLLGLTLMASIVTGFIIHRQKLKQLFTFRRKKSLDITLADSHKLFGVWGLIFNGVIAFTGAFLGLATVLLIPAAAFVSFNGDQEKLIETFNTTPEPVLAQVYEPTKLVPVLEHSFKYDEDMTVEVVTIYGYNDKNAQIYVSAIGSDSVGRALLSYKGNTGEFVESFGQFGKLGGFSAVILDLMFPLHFGNFGGAFVKLIWTVLGLSTALLPLSGLMLWIERGQRAASPSYSVNTYERFNRLVIGACGGIVLACAALFPTQLVMHSLAVQSDTAFFIGCVFFSVWTLSLIWSFIPTKASSAAAHIFYLVGSILIATPLLNAVLTDHNLISLLIGMHWVAAITDITLLALGMVSIYVTRKLISKQQTIDAESEVGALQNNLS